MWRTVRYLSAQQMWHRANFVVRRLRWKLTKATCPQIAGARLIDFRGTWAGLEAEAPCVLAEEAGRRETAIAAAVMRNEFSFLGCTRRFEDAIDWQPAGASHLWRYHLHYFGYARSLAIAGRNVGRRDAYEAFGRLVKSWIVSNAALRGDGWHPYTLSLRIVNWLQVAAIWRAELDRDPEFAPRLASSLFAQARLLRRQLELDVRGNHLLENLRALVAASLAFDHDEAREWGGTALRLLERETAEQVLADGGHFERAPGYHFVVLRLYLDLAILLERNGRPVPSWLTDAVRRMARFGNVLLPESGRIPLFKDTAYDLVPDGLDVLAAAGAWLGDDEISARGRPGLESHLLGFERRDASLATDSAASSTALSESGFYVMRSEREHLVIDAGQPCPSYLPAHAHADALSYEYSVEGQPVVVDAGVFEYQAGVWRDHFRSTRAHNTVEVAGGNSSEVWSSFRVGRRASVAVEQWEQQASRTVLVARHDGFAHLPSAALHRRLLAWQPDDFFLVVDIVEGRGAPTVASHLHFHPQLNPVAMGDDLWRIDLRAGPVWLRTGSRGRIDRSSDSDPPGSGAWYSERFGERFTATMLSLGAQTPLPAALAYAFSREPLELHVDERAAGWDVRVRGRQQRDCLFQIRAGEIGCIHS